MRLALGGTQITLLLTIDDERIDRAISSARGARRRPVVLPFIAWEQLERWAVRRAFDDRGRTTQASRRDGSVSLAWTIAAGLTWMDEQMSTDYALHRRDPHIVWTDLLEQYPTPVPSPESRLWVRYQDRKRQHWIDAGAGPVKISMHQWLLREPAPTDEACGLVVDPAVHLSFLNEPIR